MKKANDVSTIFYHVYKFGCYASGLLGAALADSYVGKYRTIFYIGIMYAIGQATLSLGAVVFVNPERKSSLIFVTACVLLL